MLHVMCRIQELSDDYTEAGRIPRTIECELTADLVDTCVPGDMVTITGVVKANNSEEGKVYSLFQSVLSSAKGSLWQLVEGRALRISACSSSTCKASLSATAKEVMLKTLHKVSIWSFPQRSVLFVCTLCTYMNTSCIRPWYMRAYMHAHHIRTCIIHALCIIWT